MSATIVGRAEINQRLRQELSIKRVAIGVLIAVGGIATVFSAPLYGLLLLVIGVLSVMEFARLAQRAGAPLSLWVAIPGVSVYVIAAYFHIGAQFESGILVGVIVASMIAAFAGGVDRFVVRWGMTVIAVLYLGKIGSYLVTLRQIPHNGAALTLWLIVVVALTDVVGMLAGLQFGKTPLAPRFSPGKTWEGAIAAFVVATAVGTMLAFIPRLGMPWYVGLVFSAAVSIAAQVGDLVESALKRNAQVKDSGQLIVGHGGVLDRFDSYFFAGVVAYAVLLWFGRVAA